MSDELFQKAKDSLKPEDIYLRESNLRLSSNFEPKYFDDDLGVQYRVSVIKSEQANITLHKKDTEENFNVFRVYLSLGARLVTLEVNLSEDDTLENNSLDIKAELSAEFIVEYLITNDDLEEEAMTEFAKRNTYYHVWPFWREYILNTFQRAHLPRVTIPTVQV